MADKQYVIAECVDCRDGKRYLPGDTFPSDAEADQVERLTKARCLSTEKPKAAPAAADDADAGTKPPSSDIEATNNVILLRAIAKKEEIDLGAARKAVDIKAAIRTARAAKAAG